MKKKKEFGKFLVVRMFSYVKEDSLIHFWCMITSRCEPKQQFTLSDLALNRRPHYRWLRLRLIYSRLRQRHRRDDSSTSGPSKLPTKVLAGCHNRIRQLHIMATGVWIGRSWSRWCPFIDSFVFFHLLSLFYTYTSILSHDFPEAAKCSHNSL